MVPVAWAYRARPVKVIDGDTIDVMVDAGFNNYRTERLRLLGLNTPELKGESRPAGIAATKFVVQWLDVRKPLDEWPLIVQTHKSDAFGRYLAKVWRVFDERCLNDDLLLEGHAVPFMVE